MSTVTIGQHVFSYTARGLKHHIHTSYYHRYCWEIERLKMKHNMAEHDSTELPEHTICSLCGESIHSQPLERPEKRKLVKDRVKMIEQFAALCEKYEQMLKDHQRSDRRVPDIAFRSAWCGKREALDHCWSWLYDLKQSRPDQVINLARKRLKFQEI